MKPPSLNARPRASWSAVTPTEWWRYTTAGNGPVPLGRKIAASTACPSGDDPSSHQVTPGTLRARSCTFQRRPPALSAAKAGAGDGDAVGEDATLDPVATEAGGCAPPPQLARISNAARARRTRPAKCFESAFTGICHLRADQPEHRERAHEGHRGKHLNAARAGLALRDPSGDAGSGAESKLAEDVLDVRLDRALAESKAVGYRAVTQALRDEHRDLTLSGTERGSFDDVRGWLGLFGVRKATGVSPLREPCLTVRRSGEAPHPRAFGECRLRRGAIS